jgi:shikimate kinase
MPKIYLIGMPGSGKSTVGKKLASKLNYSFLDFDGEIERKEGATIEAIFSLKGEPYFRQIEAQILSKVSERQKSLVVATGGGTPCYYNGLELMNSTGVTVFINVSPDVLIQRLKSDTSRPLLKAGVEQNIKKLFGDRIGVYKNALIKMEADNISTDDLIKRIVEELKLKP